MAGAYELKRVSSDIFNELSSDAVTLDNFYDKSNQYSRIMDSYMSAMGDNMTPEIKDEMDKTMAIAQNQLFKQAKAMSTNTPYVNSDGVAIPYITPLNKKTLTQNKKKAGVMEMERNVSPRNAEMLSNVVDKTDKLLNSKTAKKTTTRTAVKSAGKTDAQSVARANAPKKVTTKKAMTTKKTTVKKKVVDPKETARKKTQTKAKKTIKSTVKKIVSKAKSNFAKNKKKKVSGR